jgi:uncharacterized protein YdaU (DUF1376 family)
MNYDSKLLLEKILKEFADHKKHIDKHFVDQEAKWEQRLMDAEGKKDEHMDARASGGRVRDPKARHRVSSGDGQNRSSEAQHPS